NRASTTKEKTMMSRIGIACLALALLTACQPGLVPGTVSAKSGHRITIPPGQPVLSGRVQLPGFATKATSADVVNTAAVALIDANGVTQAGGVTDATGQFTLFPVAHGFTYADGSYFTLELSKRPAAGPVLSLQSRVRLNSGDWTSITGPTVVV